MTSNQISPSYSPSLEHDPTDPHAHLALSLSFGVSSISTVFLEYKSHLSSKDQKEHWCIVWHRYAQSLAVLASNLPTLWSLLGLCGRWNPHFTRLQSVKMENLCWVLCKSTLNYHQVWTCSRTVQKFHSQTWHPWCEPRTHHPTSSSSIRSGQRSCSSSSNPTCQEYYPVGSCQHSEGSGGSQNSGLSSNEILKCWSEGATSRAS